MRRLFAASLAVGDNSSETGSGADSSPDSGSVSFAGAVSPPGMVSPPGSVSFFVPFPGFFPLIIADCLRGLQERAGKKRRFRRRRGRLCRVPQNGVLSVHELFTFFLFLLRFLFLNTNIQLLDYLF